MIAGMQASSAQAPSDSVRPMVAAFDPTDAQAFDVVAATVVFRVVRGELCIGLPFAADAVGGERARVLPTSAPDATSADGGLADAARNAATRAMPAREIVRIASAGVRATPRMSGGGGTGGGGTGGGGTGGGKASLVVVSWAIARPVVAGPASTQTLEADEVFVPLSSLPQFDETTRLVLACAFDAFLDARVAAFLTEGVAGDSPP
jgi:hypothetical protein